MAPELLLSEVMPDRTTDVYAYGILLCEGKKLEGDRIFMVSIGICLY